MSQPCQCQGRPASDWVVGIGPVRDGLSSHIGSPKPARHSAAPSVTTAMSHCCCQDHSDVTLLWLPSGGMWCLNQFGGLMLRLGLREAVRRRENQDVKTSRCH